MSTDLTGFVIAAYLVTFLGIGAYVATLVLRVRATNKRLNALPAEPVSRFGAEIETVELSTVEGARYVR